MKEKTILVVEDHPVNLRLLRMALKRDPYVIHEAVDGEEALAMAVAQRPDLIILDIQIPKIEGCEVARKLKGDPDETIRRIPILALTASAMAGDRERILASGCDAYLSKPVDIRALKEKVSMLLSEGAE